jgi:4-aminobutyrate aminotransferase-like enzyme
MPGQGNTIILAPPLTIERSVLEDGLAILDRALRLADEAVAN